MTNEEVRSWYHAQLDLIPSRIDPSLPLERQASEASRLRNQAKWQARDLMADRTLAYQLDIKAPLKTLKGISRKSYERNVVGDDFWVSMRNGSLRTNAAVDRSLNMERNILRSFQ